MMSTVSMVIGGYYLRQFYTRVYTGGMCTHTYTDQLCTWYVRNGLGDATYSLGSSLPEHHSSVGTDVLRVFNEPEQAGGFVSCSKMFPVHSDNGCCLSGTSTVNWGLNK